MTINKSQGKSFKVVGLYLETEWFAKFQLYIGCSRAREEKLINGPDEARTRVLPRVCLAP